MRWFRRAPVPETPAVEPVPETPRDRLLAAALRERFVITLQDGSAFDGLLVDVDAKVLVLVQASTPTAGGSRVMVDGALYLERSLVHYMQRPGGLPAGEAAR